MFQRMKNTASLITLVLVGTILTMSYGSFRVQGAPPQAARLPLESLGDAKTFEELPRYGLLGPGAHNHEAGSQLVLLALKPTSVGKGDWVMAHGLLGVSMLNIGVNELRDPLKCAGNLALRRSS